MTDLARPDRPNIADKLSVIFMGSPDFAVPSLKRLAERYDVKAVFTQPPRKSGRGLKLGADRHWRCRRTARPALLLARNTERGRYTRSAGRIQG